MSTLTVCRLPSTLVPAWVSVRRSFFAGKQGLEQQRAHRPRRKHRRKDQGQGTAGEQVAIRRHDKTQSSVSAFCIVVASVWPQLVSVVMHCTLFAMLFQVCCADTSSTSLEQLTELAEVIAACLQLQHMCSACAGAVFQSHAPFGPIRSCYLVHSSCLVPINRMGGVDVFVEGKRRPCLCWKR